MSGPQRTPERRARLYHAVGVPRGASSARDRRRERALPLLLALLLAALVLAASACAPDLSEPGPAGFLPLGHGMAPAPDPDLVRAAVTPPTDAALDQAQEIVALVAGQGSRVFLANPPARHLNDIELAHFATGDVHALADAYLEAVEAGGNTSPMRPRLAWLYQRLGLIGEAHHHAELALAHRPDDPQALFVMGFLLGQDPNADDETLDRIVVLFERTLLRDPAFLGPGGVDAETLQRELRALHGRRR